jgi:hypothetical protein
MLAPLEERSLWKSSLTCSKDNKHKLIHVRVKNGINMEQNRVIQIKINIYWKDMAND